MRLIMKNVLTGGLLAALAFASAPALAQGEATADPSAHFNGAYVGVFGGLSVPKSGIGDTLSFDRNGDGSYNDSVTTSAGANAFGPGFCNGYYSSTANGSCENDRSRAEYGARIGLDRRMNNVVFGALLEVNKSNAEDATSAFSTTPAAYQLSRKLDYGVSARARLGYTPGGGALFYATGGATWAKINHRLATTNTTNSFTAVRDGKMVWGWQAGGGAEVMLTQHVSLGLEYLHTRYADNKYAVLVGQGTGPATNPFVLGGGTTSMRPTETGFTTNAFRGTLAFRF
jgi:outer membrane immunogenic protein